MWGARWGLETSYGVARSSTGGSELKLTCKMRAAWADLNRLRQQHFQASCYIFGTFWTLMSYYGICLKCL